MHTCVQLLLVYFQRNARLAFDAIAKKKKIKTINVPAAPPVCGRTKHLNGGGVLDSQPQGSSEKGAGYLSIEMSSCLRKIKG